jgi:hypothetical protein
MVKCIIGTCLPIVFSNHVTDGCFIGAEVLDRHICWSAVIC